MAEDQPEEPARWTKKELLDSFLLGPCETKDNNKNISRDASWPSLVTASSG